MRGPPARSSSSKSQGEARFVVDAMLGNVARDLRLLGFDTRYRAHAEDSQLLRIAQSEDRILVTRDRALSERCRNARSVLVTETAPRVQVVEVLRAVALTPSRATALSRCLACNQRLEAIPREEAAGWVPDHVTTTTMRYRRCGSCLKVYWDGSHSARLVARIREILDSLHPGEGQV